MEKAHTPSSSVAQCSSSYQRLSPPASPTTELRLPKLSVQQPSPLLPQAAPLSKPVWSPEPSSSESESGSMLRMQEYLKRQNIPHDAASNNSYTASVTTTTSTTSSSHAAREYDIKRKLSMKQRRPPPPEGLGSPSVARQRAKERDTKNRMKDAEVIARLKAICIEDDPTKIYKNMIKIGQG